MPVGAPNAVTAHRTAVTISVERELASADGSVERVRLSATLEGRPGGEDGPTVDELRAGLARLRSELDALAEGSKLPIPPPRSIEELVETYRPRQEELVALLEAEHEISGPEARLLRSYLAAGGVVSSAPRTDAPTLPPIQDRPIAAAPLESDRTPSTPRPIPQLLELYRIETLKQAGAVRARRQISYEEYMALKRHFSVGTPEPPPATPERTPPVEPR
jgi:hypothetical protein